MEAGGDVVSRLHSRSRFDLDEMMDFPLDNLLLLTSDYISKMRSRHWISRGPRSLVDHCTNSRAALYSEDAYQTTPSASYPPSICTSYVQYFDSGKKYQ